MKLTRIATPATELLNSSPIQQLLVTCTANAAVSARRIVPAHLRLFGTSLGLVTNCAAGIDSDLLGNLGSRASGLN